MVVAPQVAALSTPAPPSARDPLRLGHSSPVITLDTCARLWPGGDDRTRDVMDAARTPLADSLRTRGA
jgi:hypothetical protein